MANIDLTKYDSSTNFAALQQSIDHFQNNKLSLNNFQHRINYNNEFYTVDEDMLYYYKSYLYDFTLTTKLPEKFYYHPEWVSLALYNSVDLWYLILYFNEIPSFEEFNKPVIRVFNPKYMGLLNKILNKYSKEQIINNKNPEYVPKHVLKEVHIKQNRII